MRRSCLAIFMLIAAACSSSSDGALPPPASLPAGASTSGAEAYCELSTRAAELDRDFGDFLDAAAVQDYVRASNELLAEMALVSPASIAAEAAIVRDAWVDFETDLETLDGDYLRAVDLTAERMAAPEVLAAASVVEVFQTEICSSFGPNDPEVATSTTAPATTTTASTVPPDLDQTPGFEVDQAITDDEAKLFEELVESDADRAEAITSLMESTSLDPDQAECFVDNTSGELLAALGAGEAGSAEEAELFGAMETCGLPASAFIN